MFDLDATLTKCESLPRIAEHFGLAQAMEELTAQTVAGHIPFEESFRQRVDMLATLPVDGVAQFLAGMPLFIQVVNFIKQNSAQCCIVTGNLSCYVELLCRKIPCVLYASTAIVENNKVQGVREILHKAAVVKAYQAQGRTCVFVGDGHNDVEAMQQADVAVGCALVHVPPLSVLAVADYIVHSEEELCGILGTFLGDRP